MNTEFLERQADFISNSEIDKYTVHMIGCGAIGSMVAFTLMKMGISKMNLWDSDVVSKENMNNQFFYPLQIEKNKAIALSELLCTFAGDDKNNNTFSAFNYNFSCSLVKKFNPEIDILISAVDNMKTRIELYNYLLNLEETQRPKFYIECRMALQEFRIFILTHHDSYSYLRYKDELYTDENSVQQVCTNKSIMFTPMGVANIVGKMMANIVRNEEMLFYGIGYDIADFTMGFPRMTMYRTKQQTKKVMEILKKQKEKEEEEINIED